MGGGQDGVSKDRDVTGARQCGKEKEAWAPKHRPAHGAVYQHLRKSPGKHPSIE